MKVRNAQQVFKKYIPGYVPSSRLRSVWDREDSGIDCKELVDGLLREFQDKVQRVIGYNAT
jgi:hypothetical protein